MNDKLLIWEWIWDSSLGLGHYVASFEIYHSQQQGAFISGTPIISRTHVRTWMFLIVFVCVFSCVLQIHDWLSELPLSCSTADASYTGQPDVLWDDNISQMYQTVNV